MIIAILYLLVFLIICLGLVWNELSKKKLIFFIVLFLIGAIGSILFEYPLISIGLWTHLIYPQILGVSWFASLMYIPFLGISYVLGNALSKKLKTNQYLMYFIFGMIVGFILDLSSVALGFYRYNFTFPLAIYGVPLGVTLAEGIAVSLAIFIATFISEIIDEIFGQKTEKVVLITGASSGIGFATLQKLVAQDHIVYGTARTDKDLKKIKKAGGHALMVEMTNYKTIEAVVSKVIKEQGRIDVLFNNAGYGLYGTIEETSLGDAKKQFEVNLFGLARITQLVLPYMREARSGKIIVTSSMGGKVYTPLGAWYHATKHALEGWSDCLRIEVAQFGIKVVIIEPGAIQTAWGIKAVDNAEHISSKGPYKDFVRRTARIMRKNYGNPGLTSPSTIADVVSKAISSKHPKRRYIAGKYAWLTIFIRKYFGDAVYERIIMFVM